MRFYSKFTITAAYYANSYHSNICCSAQTVKGRGRNFMPPGRSAAVHERPPPPSSGDRRCRPVAPRQNAAAVYGRPARRPRETAADGDRDEFRAPAWDSENWRGIRKTGVGFGKPAWIARRFSATRGARRVPRCARIGGAPDWRCNRKPPGPPRGFPVIAFVAISRRA